jgi:hypothetical protein
MAGPDGRVWSLDALRDRPLVTGPVDGGLMMSLGQGA